MFERTIVIGDLHGCHQEALDLLEAANYSDNDRVIFVGDLVDRGPDNDKCLDLAINIQKKQKCFSSILGNHEEKHLKYLNGSVKNTNRIHQFTASQLTNEHFEWIKTLPCYIKLPEYNALVVHAGLMPNRTLDDQVKTGHIMHIQMIENENNPQSKWTSKAPDGWKFWTNFYNGPERVIFGHSVLTEPLVTEFAVGIDGGACFGLELWGVILPTWEIVKVPARKKNNKELPTYQIHGNVRSY